MLSGKTKKTFEQTEKLPKEGLEKAKLFQKGLEKF